MDRAYEFLLDFFPLIDEVAVHAPALGAALQDAGLALLDDPAWARERLSILLRLAADLGYSSPGTVSFLLDRLRT